MSPLQPRPRVRRRRAVRAAFCSLALGTAVAAALALPEAHAQSALAAGSPSASASSSAEPVPSMNAEVMVLHGTNAGAGIDPKIGPLPALKKPPFSSYDTYRLLSRTKLGLSRGSPATTTLPNGRVLQITLRDLLPEHRYRVAASINQPRGTTFLPLLEVTVPAGEPFFVAGQSYEGGMLVIGIAVR